MTYELLRPDDISTTEVEDINALLGQLTTFPNRLNVARAREVAEHSIWLVARDDAGRIRGMNTITISHIPTGKVGHLDDVVVDNSCRGQGIGEQLVRLLVNKVMSEALADRIEFTCHPNREAANRLYQRLGFHQRETNCYIKKL